MSDKEPIEVQERTFRIVKNFIRCQTCVRNLDSNLMQRGWYSKTYCNKLKTKMIDQNDPNYSIKEDREKAQSCPYYLPELSIGADLTDIQPFEVKDTQFEIDKDHADRLKQIFK